MSYLGRTDQDGKWQYEKPKETESLKARCNCNTKKGIKM